MAVNVVCYKIFNSKTAYIPDVYHTILHVLIIVTLATTIIYSVSKKKKDNFQCIGSTVDMI